MQDDHVLTELNFNLMTLRVSGVCRQNICYHVASFRDSNRFDMHHDHVLKKLNFDLLIPMVREVSAGKIFGSMLLHLVSPINMISNMTMF